jgi:uncharacterized protein YbgA (DUF1722 family)
MEKLCILSTFICIQSIVQNTTSNANTNSTSRAQLLNPYSSTSRHKLLVWPTATEWMEFPTCFTKDHHWKVTSLCSLQHKKEERSNLFSNPACHWCHLNVYEHLTGYFKTICMRSKRISFRNHFQVLYVSCVQSFDARPDIYWPYRHKKNCYR